MGCKLVRCVLRRSGGLHIGPVSLAPFGVIMVSMTPAGAGMGPAAPASNNAGIALLPRQAAAIAGLRAMIRSLGGVLGQGLIVVTMEFAPERTVGLRYDFAGFCV